jgi:signal transduction histidine kinase/CHASE3 domain sensor protein
MKFALGNRFGGAFVLALLILGTIAFVSHWTVTRLIADAAATRSAQDVQTQLVALLAAVTDAETGVRGFVIAGNPRFLEPSQEAGGRVDAALRRLQQLITDPDQERRLHALGPLAAERLTIVRQVEELRTAKGFEAAAEEVASERGKRVHDEIRRVVNELIQHQIVIQRDREQRARLTARLAQAVQIIGGLAAALVAGLAAWFSWRSERHRQAAELALMAGDALRKAILDGADYAIIAGGSTGITLFSRGAERLLGYRAGEVVGRETAAIFHDPAEIVLRAEQLSREFGTPIEPGMEVFLARARRGLPDESEWTYVRKDGSRVPVRLAVTALRNRDGEIVSFLGIAHDISQQKLAEASLHQANVELAAARDRAESADRLKSAFLATMSHELRTPLNSIGGFTGILLQELAGPLNPEQRKQLEMVRGSARHLLALINDVLDLSKIEAGEMRVAHERIDLRAVIEAAVASVRPLAESKGLVLRADATAAQPVVSDGHRVGQILLNLLSNAIKFTDRGEVTLTTVAKGATVRIHVADTGVGIARENLAMLFQPFRQLETGLDWRHDGTGLGLAICRRLAELLGGRIDAESEWRKGSVFTLTLPLTG